jgi:hypothetical protein
MAVNMSPTARGILGLVFGVFLIGLTIFLVRSEGAIYLFPCLVGPAVLPISFASLVLPVEKLYNPTEVNGKMVYDTAGTNHTPLGWGLIVFGFLLSGAFYLILNGGL